MSLGEEEQQRWGLRSGKPGKLSEGQEEVDKADEAAGWGEDQMTHMGLQEAHTQT